MFRDDEAISREARGRLRLFVVKKDRFLSLEKKVDGL